MAISRTSMSRQLFGTPKKKRKSVFGTFKPKLTLNSKKKRKAPEPEDRRVRRSRRPKRTFKFP